MTAEKKKRFDVEVEEVQNNDQMLRLLCLKSKPYVLIENIDEVIDVESFRSETNVSNDSDNDSKDVKNDVSDDETVVEEVINPVITQTSTNEIQVIEKYSKIETRAGVKYVCNSNKCKFQTIFQSIISQHIRKHELNSDFINKEELIRSKSLNSFNCFYPNCDKSYSTKSNLNNHIRNKHIEEYEDKPNKRVKREIKTPVKRTYRKSVKKELIEELIG